MHALLILTTVMPGAGPMEVRSWAGAPGSSSTCLALQARPAHPPSSTRVLVSAAQCHVPQPLHPKRPAHSSMRLALQMDRATGTTLSLDQQGVLMFSIVIITVHLQLGSVIDHWTWMHHASCWGSVGERAGDMGGLRHSHRVVCHVP